MPMTGKSARRNPFADTLSARQPGLAEDLATWVGDKLGGSYQARLFGRNLFGAPGSTNPQWMAPVNLTPVGAAIQLRDAGQQMGQGNVFGGLGNAALAVVPIPAVAKGAKGLVGAAGKKAVQAGAKEAERFVVNAIPVPERGRPSASATMGRELPDGFSVPQAHGYHGSDVEGLTVLNPGQRGALGPASYLSPYSNTASRYGDHLYEGRADGVFNGLGDYGSSINPYEMWRAQIARLTQSAPDNIRDDVASLATKLGPKDGYQLFRRLEQLHGSTRAAQDHLRRAGFSGISGWVDGPEIAVFGNQPVTRAIPRQ